MPTHIYQRPLMDQGNWSMPIQIVGQLPDYSLGSPYEGRLLILNSIGPRFVKQVGGDRLPDGTSIYIDEATAQIVVEWPALYKIPGSVTQYAAELRNADFEGTKGWNFGVGWRITTDSFRGAHSAAYQKQNGSSFTSHTSRYNVIPGRVVTAMCDVQQGASAAGNAGARVTLEWRNDEDELVFRSLGNLVDSASKGRVYKSTVKGVAPPNATKVNIGFEGVRKRENKDVWVDTFQWDMVVIDVVEPVNPSEEYYLELQVTDQTGRAAIWKGSIQLAGVYGTTKLYGFFEQDDFTQSAFFYNMTNPVPPAGFEEMLWGGSFVSLDFQMPLRAYTADPEVLGIVAGFVSLEIKLTLKQYDHPYDPADAFAHRASFVSLLIKNNPLVAQPLEDMLRVSPSFLSLEFGS